MLGQEVHDDSAARRLLVLIGSGETAARMARVQRSIVARLGDGRPASVRAAVLDTPYGFQANADAITAELVDFCTRRLGLATTVASLRRSDADVLAPATALVRLREADLVFCGPGSPSYALRHWRDTDVPKILAAKLTGGGALVFASAAALALGRLTLPVYEIYKAGEDPRWLPGLDVLSAIGVNAAVVPHYDNAEGGGHDTRYCFIGERRLRILEDQLPDSVFILGIDEHTALVIDVGEGMARVEGRGAVTVRRAGASVAYSAGTKLPLDDLRAAAGAPSPKAGPESANSSQLADTPGVLAPATDVTALVRELLTTEDPQALRAHIVAIGERTQRAEGDRERLIEPLIELLIEVRRAARAGGDYGRADAIRARLAELGIRLTDESDGSTEFEVT